MDTQNATDGGSANVLASSQAGTNDASTSSGGFQYYTFPADEFAGENVEVEFVTAGGASISVKADEVYSYSDQDGDGFYDSWETQQWIIPGGTAASFSLDPTKADTDGDGVIDSDEVDLGDLSRAGVGDSNRDRYQNRQGAIDVVSAKSNPAYADTDGDGLIDPREYHLYSVSLFTSKSDAKQFRKALVNETLSPSDYVTHRSIDTSPFRADEDGDTLDDGQERKLGTIATDANSDGDPASDRVEMQKSAGDPTMYDVAPPTVEIISASKSDGDYHLEARVKDPSGVRSYTLFLDGEKEEGDSDVDQPKAEFKETVEVSNAKRFTSFFNNNELKLRVVDESGNEQTVLTMASSDVFSESLKEHAGSWIDEDTIMKIGVMSGMSQSAGEILSQVRKLIENPKEFLGKLTNISRYLDIAGKLAKNAEKIPGMLAAQYERKMQAANPYYDLQSGKITDEREYHLFEGGFYTGVVLFEVGAAAAGGAGVASKFKKIDQVADLASNSKVQKALSYYRKAKKVERDGTRKYVTGPAARTGVRVAKWTRTRFDSGSALAKAAVRRTRTAGQQWRVTRAVQSISAGTRQQLSGVKAKAGRLVAAYPTRGPEIIDGLGAPGTKRLLDDVDLCRRASASGFSTADATVSASQGSCLSTSEVHRAVRDIDGIRRLDPETQKRVLERFEKVEDRDAYTRFVSDLDGGRIGQLLELDPQATNRLSKLYAYKTRSDGGIDLADGGKVRYRHIDNGLSGGEVLDVVQSNGDLEHSVMIVKSSKSITWLERGDSGSGFNHILERHKSDFKGSQRLDIDSNQDIKNAVMKVIKKGDAQKIPESDGGGWAYVKEINGKTVTVIVGSNGYIVTAYPGNPNI